MTAKQRYLTTLRADKKKLADMGVEQWQAMDDGARVLIAQAIETLLHRPDAISQVVGRFAYNGMAQAILQAEE